MGFRMPKVQTYGPRGIAKLAMGKANGKPVVQVHFASDDGNFTEYGEKHLIQVTEESCPKYVQSGVFYTQLSKDRRRIERMSPTEGQFRGTVIDFARREGEAPVPQTNTKARWPYEYFTPIIEIVEPERYKGMTVSPQIHYRFDPAQVEFHGKKVLAAGIPVSKSKAVEVLDNFVLATRASNLGPIPWSDNILPDLMKRIVREEAVFTFVMKDGWVNNFIPPDINEAVPFADQKEEDFTVEEPKVDFGTPDESPEFVEEGSFVPEDIEEFAPEDIEEFAPWEQTKE